MNTHTSDVDTGSNDTEVALKAFSLMIIMLTSIVGNFMVLVVIGKYLGCASFTNAFISSLSLSDLISSSLAMPLTLADVLKPGLTLNIIELCVINGFVTNLSGIVSTLMIMCLAVDRLYVIKELPYMSSTRRAAFISIAISWFLAMLVSFPWSATVDGSYLEELNRPGFHHCSCVFHGAVVGAQIYSTVILIIFYAAPIFIMSVCCFKLVLVIKRDTTKIIPVANLSNIHFSGEHKTVITVIIMIFLQIITRVPYIIMGLISTLSYHQTSDNLDTAGLWLFWFDSALNPILYAIRNPVFLELLHIRRRKAERRSASFYDLAGDSNIRNNHNAQNNLKKLSSDNDYSSIFQTSLSRMSSTNSNVSDSRRDSVGSLPNQSKQNKKRNSGGARESRRPSYFSTGNDSTSTTTTIL